MGTIKKYITRSFYSLNNYNKVGKYYLALLLVFRRTFRKYRIKKSLNEVELILKYIEYKKIDNGIVFDVGASTGSFLERFLGRGWSLFAFEPDPNPIKQKAMEYFQEKHNIKYITKACSNKSGEELPFFTSSKSTGISSLHSFDSSHHVECKVLTTTLTDFVNENEIDSIDVLKIDTEGHDYFVLQGLPWDRIKPMVIMCEFEDKKTVPLGYDYHTLGNYLLSQDYVVYVSEWFPVVEYGGSHTWRNIKLFPTELEDKNAFGNFICFRKDEFNTEFHNVIANLRLK